MELFTEENEGPELAEPFLREVLGSAGLAVEYVRAEGNTLYLRGENGAEEAVVDFAGGYGSVLLGHHHPEISALAHRLITEGTPVHAQFSRHPYANRLANALNRILHRELDTDEPYFAIFANSGAEAVEAAVKHAELDRGMRVEALRAEAAELTAAALAAVTAGAATLPEELAARFELPADLAPEDRAAALDAAVTARNAESTARPPLFLALEGGFHGKLAASVQLTHNEGYRAPFRSLAAQARFVPADRLERLAEIHAEERGTLEHLAVVDGRVEVREVEFPVFVAFLVEPIQGEGGIRVLTEEAAREIQAFAEAIDCPVLVDEIQSGMGRTGSFLASAPLGLRGDYYTLAKTLGGGIAKTSVMLVRQARYRREFEIVHSSTFAKDSFSSTIALKVLELLEAEDGRLYGQAAERGDALRAMLDSVAADHPDVVAEVRGRGLMQGLEFRDQSGSGSPEISGAAQGGLFGYVLAGHLLRAHRVRTFPTASAVNTLRFEPSLYLSDAEIAQLEAGLRDVCVLLAAEKGEVLVSV
ncbi:aspartate aminotransferase family protein [Streptomyces sp. BI20]|uniref:aspartate aminotransferase family protein n=1 Tax=Streptomyces sp. BI20 TaxID=3403460 RepID=UPI003C724B1C